MGRRALSPYNGQRFLLNINSYEVHDLDNEKVGCKINEIKREHIEMFNTLNEVKTVLIFRRRKLNGCYYCLKSEDIG